MKELDHKVNIIPIIAKADTIARSELDEFKHRIIEEIVNNEIQIYQFPTSDETVADLNQKMNSELPFAVVGSRQEIEVGGKKVRARKYPWGTVEGQSVYSQWVNNNMHFLLLISARLITAVECISKISDELGL
jgi:septin family protein